MTWVAVGVEVSIVLGLWGLAYLAVRDRDKAFIVKRPVKLEQPFVPIARLTATEGGCPTCGEEFADGEAHDHVDQSYR